MLKQIMNNSFEGVLNNMAVAKYKRLSWNWLNRQNLGTRSVN